MVIVVLCVGIGTCRDLANEKSVLRKNLDIKGGWTTLVGLCSYLITNDGRTSLSTYFSSVKCFHVQHLNFL